MEESPVANSYNFQRFIGIIIPILLLGFIAITVPFVVLENNEVLPYYPPPPGWESTVSIYLWAARFSIASIQIEYSFGGGVTNLHTTPFVIMTVLYFVIHIAVSLRKVPVKYGAGIDFIIFIIWVTVCHLIYSTLQEWSLIQVPILPIAGLSMLLVVHGSRMFQLSPTTPASSSYLSPL